MPQQGMGHEPLQALVWGNLTSGSLKEGPTPPTQAAPVYYAG